MLLGGGGQGGCIPGLGAHSHRHDQEARFCRCGHRLAPEGQVLRLCRRVRVCQRDQLDLDGLKRKQGLEEGGIGGI